MKMLDLTIAIEFKKKELSCSCISEIHPEVRIN